MVVTPDSNTEYARTVAWLVTNVVPSWVMRLREFCNNPHGQRVLARLGATLADLAIPRPEQIDKASTRWGADVAAWSAALVAAVEDERTDSAALVSWTLPISKFAEAVSAWWNVPAPTTWQPNPHLDKRSPFSTAVWDTLPDAVAADLMRIWPRLQHASVASHARRRALMPEILSVVAQDTHVHGRVRLTAELATQQRNLSLREIVAVVDELTGTPGAAAAAAPLPMCAEDLDAVAEQLEMIAASGATESVEVCGGVAVQAMGHWLWQPAGSRQRFDAGLCRQFAVFVTGIGDTHALAAAAGDCTLGWPDADPVVVRVSGHVVGSVSSNVFGWRFTPST